MLIQAFEACLKVAAVVLAAMVTVVVVAIKAGWHD